MKKCFVVLLIFVMFNCFDVVAKEQDDIYERYIENASEYSFDTVNLNEDINNYPELYNKIQNRINKLLYELIKKYIKLIVIFTLICIITSVLKAFSDSTSFGDIGQYASIVIFGVYFLYEFKILSNLGTTTVNNLTEYMNISFPGLIALLSGTGYTSTASTMQYIFVIVSNLIIVAIRKLFIPSICICAALTISNGICYSDEINKIIKTLIKFLKYSFGVILTIFSAILTFSGLTASTSDGVLIKTAKYAISNFVPIVGSCLSETLNTVIGSSLILKNSVGYLCITVIIMICAVPLIKIFVTSCVIKLMSLICTLLSNTEMTKILDNLSTVISLLGAIVALLAVIFVLLLGIIASIGG